MPIFEGWRVFAEIAARFVQQPSAGGHMTHAETGLNGPLDSPRNSIFALAGQIPARNETLAPP
jgi:hypothetical protein